MCVVFHLRYLMSFVAPSVNVVEQGWFKLYSKGKYLEEMLKLNQRVCLCIRKKVDYYYYLLYTSYTK